MLLGEGYSSVKCFKPPFQGGASVVVYSNCHCSAIICMSTSAGKELWNSIVLQDCIIAWRYDFSFLSRSSHTILCENHGKHSIFMVAISLWSIYFYLLFSATMHWWHLIVYTEGNPFIFPNTVYTVARYGASYNSQSHWSKYDYGRLRAKRPIKSLLFIRFSYSHMAANPAVLWKCIFRTGDVWEGIETPPTYGSSRSRRDLLISENANIYTLSCVPTSKVSMPHFARLAVFVDRFL